VCFVLSFVSLFRYFFFFFFQAEDGIRDFHVTGVQTCALPIFDAFNVMINYWWNTSPAFIDTPQNTLLHALLSLRDRPEPEKRAWRELFDYYVFGPPERAAAHLPEHARGILAPMDETKARRLRAQLLNRLNR